MPRPKKTSVNQDPNAPNKARRTGPLAKDEARIVNEVRKRGACYECYKKKRKCIHTREQIEASQQREQHHHQTATEKSRTISVSTTHVIQPSAQLPTHEPVQMPLDDTFRAHHAQIYNEREESQYSPNSNVTSAFGQIVAGEASHAWTMHQAASHGPGPVTGVMYVGHPVDLLTGGTLYSQAPSMTQYNKVQPIPHIYSEIMDRLSRPSLLTGQLTPPSMDYADIALPILSSAQSYQHYHLYPSQYMPEAYSPHIMTSSPPLSPCLHDNSYPSPPKTPPFSFTSFLNDDIMLPNLENTFHMDDGSMSPINSIPSTPSAYHSETSSVVDEDHGSPRTEDMSDLEYDFLVAGERNDEAYYTGSMMPDMLMG